MDTVYTFGSIEVLLAKRSGQTYKLAIKGDVTVSGSTNQPSTCSFTTFNDPVVVDRFDQIVVRYLHGHYMFWGYVLSTNEFGPWCTVSASDQLYFLLNSSVTHNYGPVSCSDFIKAICGDLGITMLGDIRDTGFVLPDIILQKSSPLDAIIQAINDTYDNTGQRYYLRDAQRNLCLQSEEDMRVPIESLNLSNTTIKSYSFKRDFQPIRNSIQVETQSETEKDSKIVTVEDAGLIEEMGARLVESATVQDGENPDNVAAQTLKNKSEEDRVLEITGAYGFPAVYGGSLVHVDLTKATNPHFQKDISGWFRVDSFTHKFSKGYHTMDLKLKEVA